MLLLVVHSSSMSTSLISHAPPCTSNPLFFQRGISGSFVAFLSQHIHCFSAFYYKFSNWLVGARKVSLVPRLRYSALAMSVGDRLGLHRILLLLFNLFLFLSYNCSRWYSDLHVIILLVKQGPISGSYMCMCVLLDPIVFIIRAEYVQYYWLMMKCLHYFVFCHIQGLFSDCTRRYGVETKK